MERRQEVLTNPGRPGVFLSAVLWAILLGAVVSSYAAVRHWWLPPLASEHGAQIDKLMNTFFVICAIVFVGVHIALALFVYRFRKTDNKPAGHSHESVTLELTWTLIPAVILLVMMIAGGVVWARMNAAPPQDAFVVEVTAQQFGWQVRYPGPSGKFGRTAPELISSRNRIGLDYEDPDNAENIVVANEIRLPVNRPVHIVLRSTDVIHSFFVPNFRVKQDVVPGRTTHSWFVPTKTGEFELACAELCGTGHFGMRGVIKVVEEAELESWLASQTPAAAQ